MNNTEFKRLRETADLTQLQVSKILGLSLRTVQRYEAGVIGIPVTVGIAVRQFKDVNFTDVIKSCI